MKRRRPGAGRPGPGAGAQMKRTKRVKRGRKQTEYHSSSDDDDNDDDNDDDESDNEDDKTAGTKSKPVQKAQQKGKTAKPGSKVGTVKRTAGAADSASDSDDDGDDDDNEGSRAGTDIRIPQLTDQASHKEAVEKMLNRSAAAAAAAASATTTSKSKKSALVNTADDGNDDLDGDAEGASSDDDDEGINSGFDSDDASDEDEDDDYGADDASDDEGDDASAKPSTGRKVKKRHDPTAFATSMTKILGSKLTTSKRVDPILTRSGTAARAADAREDARLETRARHHISAERRALLDKGRVKDVLGLGSTHTSTAGIQVREKANRRLAQRGVIKLFNAVRAAQVKGEQAERMVKQNGVVGVSGREEKVREMSKQGFLDLISAGADIPVSNRKKGIKG